MIKFVNLQESYSINESEEGSLKLQPVAKMPANPKSTLRYEREEGRGFDKVFLLANGYFASDKTKAGKDVYIAVRKGTNTTFDHRSGRGSNSEGKDDPGLIFVVVPSTGKDFLFMGGTSLNDRQVKELPEDLLNDANENGGKLTPKIIKSWDFK
ncbi:hypothetical protein CEW46_21525 [Bacillus cereus]|nr:hypothetical protein CEW46_21525 [Bacillus cereus]